MGYVTADGRHEGYLVPVFFDGKRGAGTTGGSIPDDEVVSGDLVQAADGTWTYPTRLASEVTGWMVCCDCISGDTDAHTTLVGPVSTECRRRTRRTSLSSSYTPATMRSPTSPNAPRSRRRSSTCGAPNTRLAPDALAELEADASARHRLDAAVATRAMVGRAEPRSPEPPV